MDRNCSIRRNLSILPRNQICGLSHRCCLSQSDFWIYKLDSREKTLCHLFLVWKRTSCRVSSDCVHELCSRCSRDETCKVYPLLGHYGRFQFNAFKFLRSLSSVYLQCKVLICDSSDHQSRCSQGCVSRRKRDISSYKWKADSILGPIRLKRDRSASGNSGKNKASL